MVLRVLRIFTVTGIIFVLGGIVVWPRMQLEAGGAGRLDDVRTVTELRTRIAGLERDAAEGAEALRNNVSDGRHLLAEARSERDAMAQRLDSLSRQHADLQAERKRVADALVASERELENLRGVAARAEQDLTRLRAEMLWQKVRTPEAVSAVPGPTASSPGDPTVRPGEPTANAAPAMRDTQAVASPRRIVRQEKPRSRKPPADEPKISWNPFSSLP